jgi:hypothetical protein
MKEAARIFLGMVLAPLMLLMVLAAAFLVNSYLDSRAGQAFQKIEMGASETEVIKLLGRPDVERKCGENLWWGGDYDFRGKNDGRCVTEVRYEYFLSAWAVGYTADRHVVSKYHYFSE